MEGNNRRGGFKDKEKDSLKNVKVVGFDSDRIRRLIESGLTPGIRDHTAPPDSLTRWGTAVLFRWLGTNLVWLSGFSLQFGMAVCSAEHCGNSAAAWHVVRS